MASHLSSADQVTGKYANSIAPTIALLMPKDTYTVAIWQRGRAHGVRVFTSMSGISLETLRHLPTEPGVQLS